MEKSIQFYKGSDHIEILALDDGGIFVEVNYEADQGSGEKGAAFVFTLSEFEEFMDECKRLVDYIKAKSAGEHNG